MNTVGSDSKEKCYISRDTGSNWVWVWRRPEKGRWCPINIGNEKYRNFQRDDGSLEGADAYIIDEFEEKFKINVTEGTKKCVHISSSLLDNEDYKMFSNDIKRRKKL